MAEELGIKVRVEPATTQQELQDKLNEIAKRCDPKLNVTPILDLEGEKDFQTRINKYYPDGKAKLNIAPDITDADLEAIGKKVADALQNLKITVSSVELSEEAKKGLANVPAAGNGSTTTTAASKKSTTPSTTKAPATPSTAPVINPEKEQKKVEAATKAASDATERAVKKTTEAAKRALESLDKKIRETEVKLEHVLNLKDEKESRTLANADTETLRGSLVEKRDTLQGDLASIRQLMSGTLPEGQTSVTAFGEVFTAESLKNAEVIKRIISHIQVSMLDVTAQSKDFGKALTKARNEAKSLERQLAAQGAKQAKTQDRVTNLRGKLNDFIVDTFDDVGRKTNDQVISLAGWDPDSTTAKLAVALEKKIADYNENLAAIGRLFTLKDPSASVKAFGREFNQESLNDEKSLSDLLKLIRDQKQDILKLNNDFNESLNQSLSKEQAVRDEETKSANKKKQEIQTVVKLNEQLFASSQKYLEQINRITTPEMLLSNGAPNKALNRSIESYSDLIMGLTRLRSGETDSINSFGITVTRQDLTNAEKLAQLQEIVEQRYRAIVEEIQQVNAEQQKLNQLNAEAFRSVTAMEQAYNKAYRNGANVSKNMLPKFNEEAFTAAFDSGDMKTAQSLLSAYIESCKEVTRQLSQMNSEASDYLSIQVKIKDLASLQATVLRSMDNVKMRGGIGSKAYNDSLQLYDKITKLFGALDDDFREKGGTGAGGIIAEWSKQYGYDIQQVHDLTSAVAQLRLEWGSVGRVNSKFATSDKVNNNLDALQQRIAKLTAQILDYVSANKRIGKDAGLSAEFDSLLKSLQNVETLTAKDVSQIAVRFSQLQLQTKQLGYETETLGSRLKNLFVQHLGSSIAQAGIYIIRNGLQLIYQNVVELDGAMTELKKVTDETAASYDRFLTNATTRARQLGASLNDIVQATANFAQLGYSLEEASILADAAIIYKNVGDGIEDISEATSSIISTMKAFGIETKNVMTIVDKFNEVSNRAPITNKGLGEALQNSASSLYTAGNDLNEAIALITASNATLQSPSEAGNAMKIISMRIRGATTELEAAGESTDDMVKSTAKLRDEIKDLSGIDIMVDDSTFKSTYQIMDELYEVWDTIEEIDRANIIEKLAGKNRGNVFTGLMKNWELARQVVDIAADSTGSATEENEKRLDSINGKIQQLTASFQAFSEKVLDSELVKFFFDLATAITDTANGLVDLVGAAPILVGALTELASVGKPKATGFRIVPTNALMVTWNELAA